MLPPVKGFEHKACRGRHGGPWGDKKANWTLVLGPKRQGRYPDAVAKCRACGTPVRGMAATHYERELDAAVRKSASVRHRSASWKDSKGTGGIVRRTPAARKTAAARKARTVLDRLTPTRKGRHTK